MTDEQKSERIEKEVAALETEINEVRKELREYIERKRQEESQRLKTALLAAGGVILALGSFIWWEIIWPALNIGGKS